MVDIADPASSMQYAGDLRNPLADYADVSERAYQSH